ncbi:threonine synthase [Sphingomonas daechungensis]|uniref:threonine synthase n=1 Tax=Sphingomonas daechungensis TaxID=1176646 RepID=UPI0037851452
MKFVSTRGQSPAATLSEALLSGAAPDGGLYMPDALPKAELDLLNPDEPLAEFAARLLRPFFAGDELEPHLRSICGQSFDFPITLVVPNLAKPLFHALELFNGPTGAFKDFGARFLMNCFERLAGRGPLTVLVATSGDTGGAVGCAADGRQSVRTVILFPKGRVSAFQEHQLTCWGENVTAIEIEGDFDDCQRLVKAAFCNPALCAEHRLTSANSINFGRLLPQLAYVAHAALARFKATGMKPGFVVPSGNLGHGFAVLMAKAMGLPIGPIVLATNANKTLKDWHDKGRYQPRASVQTLANAMDVGNPSNFERLSALGVQPSELRVELVTDDQIRTRIKAVYETSGYVACPHTATTFEAWWRLPKEERPDRDWIALATAHPYKFADMVEPLIGRVIEPTAALASILDRRTYKVQSAPELDDLAQVLEGSALIGQRHCAM